MTKQMYKTKITSPTTRISVTEVVEAYHEQEAIEIIKNKYKDSNTVNYKIEIIK